MTGRVPAEVSHGIALARVICIFFVMFVHTWPADHSRSLVGVVTPVFHLVYVLFTEVLGRSSVPLLSIVSGYLLASSTSLDWGRVVAHRVRTLLVPLLLWNGAMVALLIAGRSIDPTPWPIPTEFGEWANALLALQQPSANVPVAFLRDLFVCVVLAPVLLWLANRGRTVALLMLAALAVHAVFGLTGLPLIRPMILLFFATGIALRIHGIDVGRGLIRPLPVGLALVLTVASLLIGFDSGSFVSEHATWRDSALSILRRFAMAYLFWAAALALFPTRLGSKLRTLEPYIFVVFCSHAVTFAVLTPFGRRLFVDIANPLYPLYFLAQPVLALGIGVVAIVAVGRLAPRLATGLNAGRLPPRWLPWQTRALVPSDAGRD